jgi:uncharacterized membrane protein
LIDPSGLNYLSPLAPRLVSIKQGETFMAEEGGGSSGVGVVAIVVIFVLVILVGLFMFRNRIFGGGGSQKIDVNIQTPSK